MEKVEMKSDVREFNAGNKRIPFFQALFLILGSVLFALLAAEIFVRIVYKEKRITPNGGSYKLPIHESVEDLELLYKPTPGAETIQNGVLNKINNAGFRDREFSVEKTPGITRILYLGDSVAYGLDIPLEDTIPKQLEKKMIADGKKVEVMNFGVAGYETAQELIFFKNFGLRYKPDIVILNYTLNDSRFASMQLNQLNDENKWHVPSQRIKWSERIPNFFYRHSLLLRYLDREKGLFDHNEKWQFYLRGEKDIWHYVRDENRLREDAPDSAYRQLEPKIIAEAARQGAREEDLKMGLDFVGLDNYVMYSSHWNVSKRALGEFQDLAKKEGFQFEVVIFPYLSNMDKYSLGPLHEFLKAEISGMGISVTDALEPMRAAWGQYGNSLSLDGIHVNLLGSTAFSNYFKDQIEKKYFSR